MTVAETSPEIDCPYCAEKISSKAKKCKHCSEILDTTMRELEMLKSRQGDVIVTNSASSATNFPPDSLYPRRAYRTKLAAILWCFFLGALGAHKFYLGQPGLGILYFLFCWTFIPAIISFIELIYLIFIREDDFNRKFN